ncbi:MAG: M3 family metallopeptidase, partial [Opitutaceae bacterium]
EAAALGRYRREGPYNPAVGADFVRTILSRGNSAPAADLFREFMGRDPDPTALLERAGLVA